MPNPNGPMACPIDGTTLTMAERQGIEIDYCPTCRGVWLDRGELDKIIERSDRDDDDDRRPRAAPPPPAQTHGYAPPPTGYPQQGYGQQGYGKPYKKKHWLQDIFD